MHQNQPMIKFFRKIRQKLLTENNFSKYLLYAIGEILLVVLGILIALSINNWNTYRKDRIKEKELLNGIVVNLELNKKLILERIGMLDGLNKNADTVLKLQDKQIVYTDTIAIRLYVATVLPTIFDLPNQGFEYLKNEGLDIILNENIRNEIINIFNVTYNKTNIRFGKANDYHLPQNQYIVENFKIEKNKDTLGGYLRPYNVDKTLNDNYFFSIISSYKHSREYLRYFLENDLDETEKLLNKLKQSDF